MIKAELLKCLCCPETRQSLTLADKSLIDQINQDVQKSLVKSRAGMVVKESIEGGLVREDREFLYPIRGGIPILIVDEAIPLGK